MTEKITPRFQRAARWLVLALVVLILYGSLYPFLLDRNLDQPLLKLVKSLRFGGFGRGDTVANVLLYMPLGLCLVAALARNWYAVVRLILAVLVGLLLSLSIETLQTMDSARVPSLSDVTLNVIGTAVGGLFALCYQFFGLPFRPEGLAENRIVPVPLGFIALWLGTDLFPFVPALDWQKIKNAIKPIVLTPQLNEFHALRYLVGWLVVAYAVRRISSQRLAPVVLIALVAGTQFGRILVVNNVLSVSELAGICGMLLLLPILACFTSAVRLLLLACAVAAIVIAQELEPWHFMTLAQKFSWFPFKSSLSGSFEYNMSVLFEKFFWYGALVWLLRQNIRSLAGSTIAVAVLLGCLEFAQMWLPGRGPEITDVLIVLGAGFLLRLVGEERKPREA